jgi:hypothetical protein
LTTEQDRGDDDHEREHDGGQREQPLGPPAVEGDQGDAARALDLVHQQPGDQEAGDDEEDVDADEPPGQPGHARVREHDGQHGDRPQALDVRPETRRRPRPHAAQTTKAS